MNCRVRDRRWRRSGFVTQSTLCGILACAAALVSVVLGAENAAAHATLARSDPPAGATMAEPPGSIRLWFTEPLESRYTRAELLDGAGGVVAGVDSAIAPSDDHALIVTIPTDLADGAYTVAWRTLSAADGHTLQGYFGFRVGAGVVAGNVPAVASPTASEVLRSLTRALALIGLAALLAIAPVSLGVLGPAARVVPGLGARLGPRLRHYAVAVASLAIVGSLAALIAQAAAIAPETSLPEAIAQTLTETRYGQLWGWRLLGLLIVAAAVAIACWGRAAWRCRALIVATLAGLVTPVPFSLVSHAAAQDVGAAAAVAADALHLLAAAIWGGGLFLLATVLAPALRFQPSAGRREAWRVAIPRFSALAVAAWGTLILSGLYSAWLQVGSIAALTETPYGRTLLLKGALLVGVLVLAAFHFLLGWRGNSTVPAGRVGLTLAAEALLVVAVLLVVGRLIGQEPAREVLASRSPGELSVPLLFEADAGGRTGRLAISPGAVGVNAFALTVDEPALPDDSEAVLRFGFAGREMGVQELALPATGPNRFQADGPELSVAGEWRLTAVVRKIGAFSWQTETVLPVTATPPAAPEQNPAPRFSSPGAAGMALLAIGIAGLAAALLSRWAPVARRMLAGAIGAAALAGGSALLAASVIPVVQPAVSAAGAQPMSVATPLAPASADSTTHSRATPARSAAPRVTGPGTPVSSNGLRATLQLDELQPGTAELTLVLEDRDGSPVVGASVTASSEMAGMGGKTNNAAVEGAPGSYRLSDVPLTMAGDWLITVRVSPRGQPSQIFSFVVPIP